VSWPTQPQTRLRKGRVSNEKRSTNQEGRNTVDLGVLTQRKTVGVGGRVISIKGVDEVKKV